MQDCLLDHSALTPIFANTVLAAVSSSHVAQCDLRHPFAGTAKGCLKSQQKTFRLQMYVRTLNVANQKQISLDENKLKGLPVRHYKDFC
jgi:hypothetical protein